MIKDENYIQISGWMRKELNLKGAELFIYALIYGFSQDGKSAFTGSLNYICEWTDLSKQGVIKCLKSLLEKNLIRKENFMINNVKLCKYWALRPVKEEAVIKTVKGSQLSLPPRSTEINTGSQLSLPPQSTEFNKGSQLSLPNISNDKTKDKTTHTPIEKKQDKTDSVAINYLKPPREQEYFNTLIKLFGYNPGFEPDPYPELIKNLESCSVSTEYLSEYLEWAYDILKKDCKQQDKFIGYFYKSFTKSYNISAFWQKKQVEEQKKTKQSLNIIYCPVCGAKHQKSDFRCPECECSEEVFDDEKILNFEKLKWDLKKNNPEKYEEYSAKLKILWENYPLFDRIRNKAKQAEYEKAEAEINRCYLQIQTA